MSQGKGKEAAILYPTTEIDAEEAVLDVNDPVKDDVPGADPDAAGEPP